MRQSIIFKLKMGKILGLGNALVDYIVRLTDDKTLMDLGLPKGSMTLVDQEHSRQYRDELKSIPSQMASGGSAANTARGVAKLGVECGYIGKLGDDENGRFFLRDLESTGVHGHMLNGSVDSGVALTLITPDSERTFATYLGSAIELKADDLDPELFAKYDILHMEGYLVQNQELFKKALEISANEGLVVSLDLASYNVVEDSLKFLRKILPVNVDILFANESEARAYSGKQNLEEILNDFSLVFPQVIIKTGADGCMIAKGKERWKVPAEPADVIDTNGAGDLFAAGYLAGFAYGRAPEECARLGASMAARVIEVIGTSIPDEVWTEIRKKNASLLQYPLA